MRVRLQRARVGHLATVTPDGRPHIVPCTFVVASHALAGDTLYSAIDAKPKTTTELARLQNIEAQGTAALLVDHYEDDWFRLWWVRVRGKARVIREGDERERALDDLSRKYRQYTETRPPGPVVAIDVDEWRGWAAS